MTTTSILKGQSGMKDIRIIVSGGGTGGHIYPAVAVVETLEKRLGKEHVEVLFVGAEGKWRCRRSLHWDIG